MKFLIPLLLLLAGSAEAATYAMKACAGGAAEHRDVDCGPGDCCPAVLSAATGSATSTTLATVQVNTTVELGTVFVCITESATPLDTFNPANAAFDPTDQTGCAGYDDTPVVGTPVQLTGIGELTPETTYYAHTQQRYETRWAPATATTLAFTTPASMGGGGGGPSVTDGHWIVITSCRASTNCQGMTSTDLNSDAVGLIFQVFWGDFESGNNQWNFTWFQNAVNTAKAAGKKWGVQWRYSRFGNFSSCKTATPTADCRAQMVPDFMWTSATYGYDAANYPNVKGGSMIIANNNMYTMWQDPDLRAQWLEFMQQWNTVFGNDTSFEATQLSESTASAGTPSNGYSTTSWVAGLQDRAAKTRAGLGPDHAIYQMTNFLPSEAQFGGDPWLFAQNLDQVSNVWFSAPDDSDCTQPGLIALWVSVKAAWGGTEKIFTQVQNATMETAIEVGCQTAGDPAPDVYSIVRDCLNPQQKAWFRSNPYSTSVLNVINNAATYPFPAAGSGTCPLPTTSPP